MKNKKSIGLLFLVILILGMSFAMAQQSTTPEAPSVFDVLGQYRRDTSADGQQLEAIAGNITALSVHGFTTTRSWFGVYGNITGTLVLSNGDNEVMYDWAVANPKGQIYATTALPSGPEAEPIVWNEVTCYSFSQILFEEYYTLNRFHEDLGINGTSDMDSVNRTFSRTDHNPFYVGSRLLSNCPTTSIYNASGVQDPNRYQEVLLYNNAGWTPGTPGFENQSVIFTGLIEDEAVIGFNGQDMDFQMILTENGRGGNTDTTTYFFYVELE